MDSFKVYPLILEDDLVRLEPLAAHHVPGLLQVGKDADIWAFIPGEAFSSEEEVSEWIAKASQHGDVAFAVIHKPTGRIVGTTRFMNVHQESRGLEIGSTWYEAKARRTGINTACKYLLLNTAFELYGAERVQMKTDANNAASRKAIERIGGVFEGILRKHMRIRQDYIRDSAYYSIVRDEWPTVKQRIEYLMAQYTN